ncbi:MAG: hypothetical protein U1F05_11910 [Burkholderiales bacterium]
MNRISSALLVFALSLGGVFASCPTHGQAVRVNPDGTGQALIYPYYTVRNGWVTLMSVVNHDLARAKALRVRFVEGRNGATVASFNLFLTPGDVWTGAALPGATDADPPLLVSNDQSCAGGSVDLTRSPRLQLAFTSSNYRGDTALPAYQSIDRTREGFIEVIEIGSVSRGTRLFDQIIRRGNYKELPPLCNTVRDADMVLYGEEPLQPPTGGVAGGGTLMNLAGGMSAEYTAVALDHLWINSLNTTIRMTTSIDALPSLASGDNKVADVHVGGQRRLLTYATAVDAVSATLMSNQLAGEYAYTEDGVIRTSWVFTAPTRRYYMRGDATRPFARPWDSASANACEGAEFDMSFDREGLGGTYDDFPTRPFIPNEGVCFHATVLSFGSRGSDLLFDSKNWYGVRYQGVQGGGQLVRNPGKEGGHGLLRVYNGLALRNGEGRTIAVNSAGEIAFDRVGPLTLAGLPLIGTGITTLKYSSSNPQQNYANGFPLTSGSSIQTP